MQRFLSTEPDAKPVPTALTTMVHHPALAGPFLAYNNVLLANPALGHRMRELIVLRVAWRTQSAYEWAQHVMLAPRFDITPDDIDAIARDDGADGVDAGRARARRGHRSARRRPSRRRRHLGAPGRAPRRATTRRAGVRRRHVRLPRDGLQQLRLAVGGRNRRAPAPSAQVTTGRRSQPRTVEVRACAALSQSTSHVGKRCSTSSSAMRPSSRASAAPMQKWTPYPNAR